MNDFIEINRMTIPEFEIRMKASELKKLDRIHEIHILAWAINQAGATKKNGRPVYRTFRSFFDFEKQERKIMGIVKEKSSYFKKVVSFLENSKNGGGK